MGRTSVIAIKLLMLLICFMCITYHDLDAAVNAEATTFLTLHFNRSSPKGLSYGLKRLPPLVTRSAHGLKFKTHREKVCSLGRNRYPLLRKSLAPILAPLCYCFKDKKTFLTVFPLLMLSILLLDRFISILFGRNIDMTYTKLRMDSMRSGEQKNTAVGMDTSVPHSSSPPEMRTTGKDRLPGTKNMPRRDM